MIDTLLDFCFPPLCPLCALRKEKRGHLFCFACTQLLDFLEPKERCPRCFTLLGKRKCPACFFKGPFYRTLVCFAQNRTSFYLHSAWKTGPFDLEKTLAALLFTRWHKLGYPEPTLIVPVPSAPFCAAPQLPVAKELAVLFGVPMKKALAADWECGTNRLYYTLKGEVLGETVLLFSLFYDYEELFLSCAKSLKTGFPKKVMALAGLLSSASD